MVEKMFADTFQPQIEEFYKRVQKAMSDGDITDAERNTLRSEAEKLANDIVAAKDILSDTLGITESNMKKELEEEFKSFSDDILNSLTNAEVTAEAVAKNISAVASISYKEFRIPSENDSHSCSASLRAFSASLAASSARLMAPVSRVGKSLLAASKCRHRLSEFRLSSRPESCARPYQWHRLS